MNEIVFGSFGGGMSSAVAQRMISSIVRAEQEEHNVTIDTESEYQKLMLIDKPDRIIEDELE